MSVAVSLTPDLASKFARLVLGHVRSEYPTKLDHVLNGPGDLRSPRELHPIFFGSFDWHSCVHGYWLLATVLRRFPSLPEAQEITALFDAQLSDSNIAAEVEYLKQPLRATFERPYGWAWLLMLSAELARQGTKGGKRWSGALQPLTDAFVERFRGFLPKATYPYGSELTSTAHSRWRWGSNTRLRSAMKICGSFSSARRSPGTATMSIVRRGSPAGTISSRRR